MGSETLTSTCYILFPEYNIPFYFTSNGLSIRKFVLSLCDIHNLLVGGTLINLFVEMRNCMEISIQVHECIM